MGCTGARALRTNARFVPTPSTDATRSSQFLVWLRGHDTQHAAITRPNGLPHAHFIKGMSELQSSSEDAFGSPSSFVVSVPFELVASLVDVDVPVAVP